VSNLHDSGPGSLREAVRYAEANPGTVIHFVPGLCGTINLTSGELDITQNTVIDGPGARRLAVSGMSHSRVFAISSGATVTISGLTITGGLADDKAPRFPGLGGGILNEANLTLTGVVVSHNQAAGAAKDTISLCGYSLTGAGAGGGVANLGTLHLSDSRFEGNEARGASGSSDSKAGGNTLPGVASGGGLANVGMTCATVTNCSFTDNVAQAGDRCIGTEAIDPKTRTKTNTDIAGDAIGGAIASLGFTPLNSASKNIATLTVCGSRFSNNQALAGNDNKSPVLPGHAIGGAIASHRFNGTAELNVRGSLFHHNQAIAGNHNVVTMANDRGQPNSAVAGGVFVCGKGTISRSKFHDNRAIGGQGVAGSIGIPITKNGGNARGGGIGFAFPTTDVCVSNCTVRHNLAIGGQAGAGGSGATASGGGVAISAAGPTLTITAGIIDNNQAQGGGGDNSGPPSNGGDGQGGGVYNIAGSKMTVTAGKITANWATGGKGKHGGSDGQGIGGGLYLLGTFTVDPTTVISKNHASTSNDNVHP
jgi:hypothetical protein